jgi:hypothetical protein
LKDQRMKKVPILALAIASALVTFPSRASVFADSVIAYDPGTGASSGFNNTTTVLGSPTATANPFSPAFRNTQLLSLGAGGSLTVGFSTPIENSGHPYGLDFIIFGNAGFTITNGNFSGGGITDGSMFGNNPGTTRVSVSEDGVTYYQLDTALAPVVDGLFPTDGSGNVQQPVDPSLTASNFAGLGLAGIRSLYAGSAGGTGFDISWAEDGGGNPVSLAAISFIRVDVLSGKSEIDAIAAVPEPGPAGFAVVALIVFGLKSGVMFKRRTTSALNPWSKPIECRADIPVCQFRRLSSRQYPGVGSTLPRRRCAGSFPSGIQSRS